MENKSTPRPRRGFWAKILYTLALGPLPFGLITIAARFNRPYNDSVACMFTVMLGAYWGLTLGVMRGSLLRMIVGLNLGALTGLSFFKLYFDRIGSRDEWVVMSGFAVCGMLLFGAVCFNRKFPFRSTVYNFAIVSVAATVLFISMYCINKILNHGLIQNSMRVMLPLSFGAAILVWFLGEDEPPAIYQRVRTKLFSVPRANSDVNR